MGFESSHKLTNPLEKPINGQFEIPFGEKTYEQSQKEIVEKYDLNANHLDVAKFRADTINHEYPNVWAYYEPRGIRYRILITERPDSEPN